MKPVHNLLDARVVVPPVNVENIDVTSAKLLQRSLHGEVERLDAVANETCFVLHAGVTTFIVGGILSGRMSLWLPMMPYRLGSPW